MGEELLEPTVLHPASQGRQLEAGTHAVASINTPPSSTEDRKIEGDQGTRLASKPTHCYFGMKTQPAHPSVRHPFLDYKVEYPGPR